MASMITSFAGNGTTSSSTNTPLSIKAILSTAGYTGQSALIQLIIQPTGAGNLVITSNASATAETDGYLLTTTLTFPTLDMYGSQQSPIQSANLYLLSATASKTFGIIVTSVA